MRHFLAFLSITLVLGALPVQAATVTEQYVAGPAGDADGLCRHDTPTPSVTPNVGVVCFPNVAGKGSVGLTIRDAAPWTVGFWAGFTRSNGSSMGGRWYCTPAVTVSVPSGAARMYVYIGGARAPVEACPDGVGVGTNGTVTAVL